MNKFKMLATLLIVLLVCQSVFGFWGIVLTGAKAVGKTAKYWVPIAGALGITGYAWYALDQEYTINIIGIDFTKDASNGIVDAAKTQRFTFDSEKQKIEVQSKYPIKALGNTKHLFDIVLVSYDRVPPFAPAVFKLEGPLIDKSGIPLAERQGVQIPHGANPPRIIDLPGLLTVELGPTDSETSVAGLVKGYGLTGVTIQFSPKAMSWLVENSGNAQDAQASVAAMLGGTAQPPAAQPGGVIPAGTTEFAVAIVGPSEAKISQKTTFVAQVANNQGAVGLTWYLDGAEQAALKDRPSAEFVFSAEKQYTIKVQAFDAGANKRVENTLAVTAKKEVSVTPPTGTGEDEWYILK